MKILRLKNLYLISMTERKAKKIPFHEKVTVIKGENDTGKSSIIKSIYWCLGAEPAVISDRWKELSPTGVLEFSVDGEEYSVIRTGNLFGIFNAYGSLLLKTASVAEGITPFISRLLDFGLHLTNREGDPEIPPPAYCFLPFYIDQDQGWVAQWNSFQNLGQYSSWKKSIIPYHSGIKPNEFFIINAQLTQERQRKLEKESERRTINSAALRIKGRQKAISIDIDAESYKKAIADLLKELSALQGQRSILMAQLSDHHNQKAMLEEQMGIVRAALSEFDKDYKFIQGHDHDAISCPTCGAEYENSFFHRFSLIEDREACRQFLSKNSSNLEAISTKISKSNAKINHGNFRITKINSILDQKKKKLRLRDVIDAEAEKKAHQLMVAEIEGIERDLQKCNLRIARLQDDIKKYDDPDRKSNIQGFYHEKIIKFSRSLNLNLEFPPFIDYKIKETGNDRPRAMLAYFYAYLHTVREFTTSCFCPVIIDSPKQQDPDPNNTIATFDLIFSQMPDDTQLILGTVSLPDVTFEGHSITLSDKYSLLQEGEFEEVSSHINPRIHLLYS
ncbi:AAA family ATPase [Nitrospirillum sp. BR 11163]|uniref:AAA family ATPase n=1 Tax=Nitrospirillum sp. BR 11163 TaxID=3104323 RepID=UPI002AFF25AA|nr:AAA family ATPase [Nitrospirillum sp. BR 11163]MEA1675486.1 hypothetical protein [Nitrospirillum sp. BR 11163]